MEFLSSESERSFRRISGTGLWALEFVISQVESIKPKAVQTYFGGAEAELVFEVLPILESPRQVFRW